MNTLLRTLQTNFPYLLDTKFALMRTYRNILRIPFEEDFYALRLFPDIGEVLFLDVGANRGQSTDAILLQTKNSRVQLFEPNTLLCDKLERQYGVDKRIVINRFGLGDKTTEQILNIPFYKQWMFDGLASFDEDSARSWLEGRLYFYNERCLSIRKITCHIKRLDELDLAPFFVKLDIQGYEFQALKGGEKTIKTYEPILLIESPNKKTISYLIDLGYQFYAFKQGRFMPGATGELNTFFMTKNKSSMVEMHIT